MSSEPSSAPDSPRGPEEDESEAPKSLWSRLVAHRRRLATVAMVALLLLLVTHGSHVLPSTLELAIPISTPSGVEMIEVTLRDADGEEAHRMTRRFHGDAPEALEMDVSLLPGAYAVEVRTQRSSGQSLLEGSVEVPAEGRVRLRLHTP